MSEEPENNDEPTVPEPIVTTDETPDETPAPVTPAPEVPLAPPYVAPLPGQQVQYVNIVNQKSLEGLSGWLMFWLVVFALNGLGYITFFFGLLASPEPFKEAFSLVSIIFMPIMAAAYITSAVFIAMRKKLAVLTSVGAFGVAALYMSIMMIISASQSGSPASQMIPMTIGLVLAILVSNGLFALYFFVSKRVKATLIG
jgi:hypothetical protein